MDKPPKKTSAFGLSGEKIARLLSIGREDDLSAVGREDRYSVELRIEGYEIVEKIAEAGQGQVWRALQESTGRHVAIKVPRLGSVTSERARIRFEREIELAARLKHPNIARIYDSGMDRGQYYYVMDFVEGLSLDEYVGQNKLTQRQILELVRAVCLAVQHAHQNRVIHRDLKPSNIIVTEDGHPYIVDFGLAKAIVEDEQGPTISMDGESVGTPAYMSPEQAAGRADEVDTRTDIYSLGVILFNLLTGESPHDLSGSRQQVLRRIADEQVKRPRTVCRSIDRDLETLLLKMLDRDPNRRYSTASSLADDIKNYLDDAPLMAGPPSTTYRLMKFVRRNVALSSVVLAAVGILIVGLIMTTAMYIQADRARAETQAVFDFLQTSVLQSLDPYTVGGKVTIHSFLDTFSERLETELTIQPLAKASIQQTLGFGYWSLGLYEQFEEHTRCAVEVYEKHLGSQDYHTLSAKGLLGWAYYFQSRYKKAEPLFTQAAEGIPRLLGEGDPNTLHPIASLGYLYNKQGRFNEANDLFAKVLKIMRNKDNKISGHVMSNVLMLVGGAYMLQGRFEEAEILAKQGLKVSTPARGEQGYETVSIRYGLGILYRELGLYGEAEQLLEGALIDRRDVWGEDHPETLKTMVRLGWLHYSQGRNEKAEALCDEVLETTQRVLGATHKITADCMHMLGTVYLSQGRYHDAELFLDKALKIMDQILGEESWASLSIKNTKGKLYTAQDRLEDAELLFEKTLETQRVVLGNDHPYTLDSMNGFAVLLTKLKKYDDAERLFNEALEGRQNKLGDDHPATLETKNDLAVLYKKQGDYPKAERLLLEAVKGRRLKLGDTHPHTLESWQNLIDLYKASNKPEEAEEWRPRLARCDDAE